MLKTEEISKIENFKILKLSVFENNELALKLYIKNGFKIISIKDNKCLMSKDLRNK
jgi:ribosomal protein S18 acetylase RimI-like enzyme